jgi:uncharacterized protein involved in exopolysaccharide biosynthesis/Mrp family chromosome partitioning ATPase
MSNALQKPDSLQPITVEPRSPSVLRTTSGVRGSRRGPEPSASWQRYVETVFMYRSLILGSLLLAILTGWLALLVWPRQYESEAKLMVRVGRESVSLDPTATTSETLMLQKTQEEEVNSVLEVLRSRQIAERVVDRLGPKPILHGRLPGGSTAEAGTKTLFDDVKSAVQDSLFSVLLALGVKDDLSDRELAIMDLQETMDIAAERRSTVVSIHAFSATPEMAQAIAQAVSDEFIDEYLEVTHNFGSSEFFQTQAHAAAEIVETLAQEKNQFMHERKLVDIADNRQLLVTQLGLIEGEMITTIAELQQVAAEIEELKRKQQSVPDEIVAAKQQASDSTWSGMRQRVYELELQERMLAAKYADDHVLLAQVREQLEGAQAILAKLQSERLDESKTPNPSRVGLDDDLRRLETRLSGLQASLKTRESQHTKIEQQLSRLLDYELELDEMERGIKVAEDRLILLRGKEEEARVLDEMKADHISNLSLFQPATLVERAVSPNKKLLVLALAILGLTGGMAIAIFREVNSNKLRTPSDVEGRIELPVVANMRRVQRSIPLAELLRTVRQQPDLLSQCRMAITDIVLSKSFQNTDGLRGKTLGIIGVESGAGATTVASALAWAATQECGLETTLIDADFEHRSLSKLFNLNGAPGLSELARGDATHSECIQRTTDHRINLVSSSSSYETERQTDATPKSINAAIQHFQETSDLVIIDLPAADSGDREVAVTQYLDYVLVVVESEKTSSAAAQRLVRKLCTNDKQTLAVVLNKTRRYLPHWLSRSMGMED